MASVSTPLAVPPTTAEALASFSENISRAIMTSTSPKPTKQHQTLDDELPPAPPPSPVSFAVDSNRKTSKPKHKHEKIPSMSLE